MSQVATDTFNVQTLREDFPILSREVNGKPLVYLDNGASSQKPKMVVEAISNYYYGYHANVHRGVHTLSQEATDLFESARKKLANWFNIKHTHELIFTKGTTDAINLVASSFVERFVNKGDEIIVSQMEHHSNLVPWQIACKRHGAVLKVIPFAKDGSYLFSALEKAITPKTKLIAVNHVSNTLGTINPIEDIVALARKHNAKVLVDGAQSVPHMKIDLQALDVDFFATSSHKMYGPTGIGFLYGKEELLNEMPPYQGGGEMISSVDLYESQWADLPFKFEAGTPNIADAIGFGAAVDWMQSIDFEVAKKHEESLLHYATKKLSAIEGLTIYGTAEKKASVISFLLDGIHPYDVGTILDQLGIAVRTGHHCTETIMKFYGIPGTVRASFAFYNTHEEVDALVKGVERAKRMLS